MAITADDKARSYGSANPALTYIATGFVNGDTVATAVTGGLATTATASSPVGTYPITQGTLAAANYTISFTDGTLTISNAVLNVVADPQTRLYGAANPALTYTVTGFTNGDNVGIMTGLLATPATVTSGVGSYPITQGTLAAPNYAINYTGDSLTITPAPLTVTADDQSRPYGSANPGLTFAASGFMNGDTIATALTGGLATTATPASNVGTYPIGQGSLTSTNYTITFVDGTLTVTSVALAVTADGQTRLYGASNPALTVTASGFVNGDTIATALTGTLATTAVNTSPVGSYPITQGSLAAINYTISFTDGTLAITPAPLSVIADNKARIFGAANPPLTFTGTGFVNGETAGTALTGQLATTALTVSPVGNYPITQGTLAALNYTISFTDGTLTIGSAILDIVADPQVRAYGTANPALTYTATGFVNGDTASIITGGLATSATSASDVGSYAITQGTLAAPNYAINYTGAALQITPVVLRATADNQSRIYGAPNPTLTISYSGFVNGDTASVIDIPPTASTPAIPTSPIGSYPITPSGGSDNNYTFDYVAGTIAVTPTGQNPCAGSSLQAALSAPGPMINLDGSCRYVLTDLTGTNGHIINLFAKSNLTINGNGAIIERSASAGDLGILALFDSSNVTIQNLTFMGGKATAGGTQLGGRGGAVMLYNSTNVTIAGVQFYRNSATFGGALSTFGGSTRLSNSVFADNQAASDGAAVYFQGDATVVNTTITATTPNPGEAIFTWNALTVENSILAQHAVGIAAAGGSNPVSEDYNLFSDVEQSTRLYNAGTTITNGIHSFTTSDINEHFIDPSHDDYRLKVSSPALDRGTPVSDVKDADGRTRPFGNTAFDLGAYEFQGDGSLGIRKLGPHWVLANTTFTYELVVANNGINTLTDLQVQDTLPAGVSFVGGLTNGGVFDGTTIRWDIAALAPNEILMLTYQVRISQGVINSAYRVVRASDSAVLATGPVLETLVNPAIKLQLQHNGHYFTPGLDGFSFANWQDTPSDVELTAASMYLLYGPEVCATGTGGSANSCVLTATAEQQLQSLREMNANGRAFGMVAASLRLFLGQPLADGSMSPADYQAGAAKTADLLRYAELQQIVELYQAGRGSPAQGAPATLDSVTDGTPAALVTYLLANGFDGPANNDGITLSLQQRDGSGALALLPYALEQQSGTVYWLYVYDPGSPGDAVRAIEIDTAANTWKYLSGGQVVPGYAGDATSHTIFFRSLVGDTSAPRSCGLCGSSGDATDSISYSMNGEGRFLITNSAGQRVGYDPVTGTYINEIPGATIDFIEAGPGLDLPPVIHVPLDDTYTAALFQSPNGTGDETVELNIIAPGMVIGLDNLQLGSASDPAELTVDYASREVGFEASIVSDSNVVLELAIQQSDGNSYNFGLTGVDLAPGNSVTMGFNPATGQLTLKDDDNDQNQRYDLVITRVQPGGASQVVQRNDVTSSTGSGAVIDFNNWDGQSWPTTTKIPNYVYLALVTR